MQEKDTLNVVADQFGSPTWASNLATAIWKLVICGQESGIYHYSDNGTATWFEFAQAIHTEGVRLGLISNSVEINPVSSLQYRTAAQRPKYSVLGDKVKPPLTDADFEEWEQALREMLIDLKENGSLYQVVDKRQQT